MKVANLDGWKVDWTAVLKVENLDVGKVASKAGSTAVH